MGVALLVWLMLLFFCSSRFGWFGCLLALLFIVVLVAGCV